jgi:hypothetical protein
MGELYFSRIVNYDCNEIYIAIQFLQLNAQGRMHRLKEL